jgi:hypothetical protein
VPPNSSPGDPIETFTLFILISTQKDNINAILDEQVVFTRYCKAQLFLLCWVGKPNLYCTWIARDTLQQMI